VTKRYPTDSIDACCTSQSAKTNLRGSLFLRRLSLRPPALSAVTLISPPSALRYAAPQSRRQTFSSLRPSAYLGVSAVTLISPQSALRYAERNAEKKIWLRLCCTAIRWNRMLIYCLAMLSRLQSAPLDDYFSSLNPVISRSEELRRNQLEDVRPLV
jgi:hypothetical protein